MSEDRHHDAACPRCGYDLRGTVVTWGSAGACPLDGTCTECGLTFRWVDVFDPTREEPQWCVEYAPRRPWPLVRAMVGTFARSWLPWRFWYRLRLHHRVRPMRLALYAVALVLLPLLVMYVVTQTTFALIVYQESRSAVAADLPPTADQVQAIRDRLTAWVTYQWIEDAPEIDADYARETALNLRRKFAEYADYRDLDERTPEGWDRLKRIALADLKGQLDFEQSRLDSPSEVRMSASLALCEAILTPLAAESFGSIVLGGQEERYCPPRDIHARALMFRVGGVDLTITAAVSASAALSASMTFLLVFPFTFVLLFTTRRRAKVRWVHFLRPTAYGFFIPATILVVASCLLLSSIVLWPMRNLGPSLATALAVAGTPAALVTWWYFAVNRHLRLPHPLPVTLIMSLLSAVVTVWVWGCCLGAAGWILG